MATLYLRNVPEETGEHLRLLAERAGLSVSAFAVRELVAVARRASNPALLGGLADHHIGVDEVVADLDLGRASR